MSAPRAEWIKRVQAHEDETARALAAQAEAVELRLALRGAQRRGGYFDRDNVEPALRGLVVIEAALAVYCERLRNERGQLRKGEQACSK